MIALFTSKGRTTSERVLNLESAVTQMITCHNSTAEMIQHMSDKQTEFQHRVHKDIKDLSAALESSMNEQKKQMQTEADRKYVTVTYFKDWQLKFLLKILAGFIVVAASAAGIIITSAVKVVSVN